MEIAYCNSCGGELPDRAKFCQRCGATADGSMTPADLSLHPSHTSSFPSELEELYDSPFLIGKGGFARVFKAKRKSDGKWVAVKVPISLDVSTGRSFIKEITAWQRLDHENIVRL